MSEVSRVIEFDVPGLRIESANVTRDRHWSVRKRRSDEYCKAVMYSASACGVYGTRQWPFARTATITITRIAPRALDDDNAISGAKAVRDAIACLLGLDDGSPLLTWRYAQRKGKPREYAVHIRIESALQADGNVRG